MFGHSSQVWGLVLGGSVCSTGLETDHCESVPTPDKSRCPTSLAVI